MMSDYDRRRSKPGKNCSATQGEKKKG